ncbi:hypothetical protein FHS83_001077 [Rhizomicrobium palustre]|uniref:Uncharacterized protein n=1 Tax=Rhizomicrobium palustre TaxID=189966 RepID=A0A846MWZ0_9PROT|nr:hypothetical protein [Rhizomicrobium palustre]NIK87759.1 hypothetical protein [Rhizomicrobium palustre]
MLRAILFSAVLAVGSAEAASFELRLDTPCEGASKPYLLQGTSHEHCLAPEKVFDAAGVVRVQRYPVIAKAIVDITPDATEKLLKATTDVDGKGIGVLFNEKLIFFAPVHDPLKLEKLILTLNNAPDEVDALVAAFPGQSS